MVCARFIKIYFILCSYTTYFYYRIAKLRGVATKYKIYFFTMQTFKELIIIKIICCLNTRSFKDSVHRTQRTLKIPICF